MDNSIYLIVNYDKSSSRHYHITYIFDYLVSLDNTKYFFVDGEELISHSSNITDLNDFFITKYKQIPKYIISFSGIGGFNGCYKILVELTKLVFIVDDIHHAKSVRAPRIPVIKNSSIIFGTYSYQFERWGLPKPKKLHFFPHSCRWICDYNSKPINKILISGRISDIYPDRQFAYSYAKNNPNLFDVLDCNINYRTNVSDIDNPLAIYGEKFYLYLNKYLCCFVDTARDYILAKVFEICGSGSLLLCMDTNVKNIMSELGFIDNINYISCSRDNFDEKIDYITNISNIDDINTIRKRGYELVKNKHTWYERMEFFTNIIENN